MLIPYYVDFWIARQGVVVSVPPTRFARPFKAQLLRQNLQWTTWRSLTSQAELQIFARVLDGRFGCSLGRMPGSSKPQWTPPILAFIWDYSRMVTCFKPQKVLKLKSSWLAASCHYRRQTLQKQGVNNNFEAFSIQSEPTRKHPFHLFSIPLYTLDSINQMKSMWQVPYILIATKSSPGGADWQRSGYQSTLDPPVASLSCRATH